MANPFDQFDSQHDAAVQQAQPETGQVLGNPFDQFDDPNAPDTSILGTMADQGLQGASFGTSDEIKGYGGAAIIKGMEGLGLINTGGKSYDDLVKMELAHERANLAAQQAARPDLSMASQLVGSLPTGLAGAEKLAGTKALGWVGALPRVGGVASDATIGAGLAGAYGAGEGEGGAGNRLQSAAEAAPYGAVGGVVAPRVINAGIGITKGAAGKVGDMFSADSSPAASSTSLSPAQKLLQDSITPEEAARSVQLMDDTANKTGVNLPPAAALNSPKIGAMADTLAQNPETSNIAQKGASTLSGQAADMSNNAVEGLSPSSQYEGAQNFAQATTDMLDAKRQAMVNEASPYFTKAFTNPDGTYKFIPATKLKSLQDNPWYDSYAKQIASNPKFENLPEGSLAFVHQVRSLALSDKRALSSNPIVRAQNAKDIGGLNVLQSKALNLINEGLDAKSAANYQAGRAIYSVDSAGLESHYNSPIGKVAKMIGEDATKAPNMIMSKSPEFIAKTKAMYDPEVWNGMVKSWMQGNGENLFKTLNKSVGGNANWDRLTAALNPEQVLGFQHVINTLDRAKAIPQNSLTFQRAATQHMLNNNLQTATGSAVQKAVLPLRAYGAAKEAIARPRDALIGISGKFTDPQAMQELTGYLFDASKGRAELARIAKTGNSAQRQQLSIQFMNNAKAFSAAKVAQSAITPAILPKPTQDDITMLRGNPTKLAPHFDEVYGQGAAQNALKKN